MSDSRQLQDQQPTPSGQSDGTLGLQVSSGGESKEALKRKPGEKVPVVEVREPEVAKEVEGWVEKLEKGEDTQLPKPVVDDYGQVLVQAAVTQKPKIVLPLDVNQVTSGLGQKVGNSIRWLAEWCVRLLKMWPGRVRYKK